ncbi:MAG: dTDP-4-dehydrorhamnose reductase [Gammaproteobacteria bacterium]|nr:dTDP-4-dehydrorhamnose reductase [Gammaproteobacteria bacterium]|tara:strand:+ start:1505 stop:2377 length:873 start_codon:yes stop_codon:yes gene_type:complete
MSILVFGQNGQLGKCLRDTQPQGMEVFYSGRADVDLCNTQCLERYLDEKRPDVIINAGAYTEVDIAEKESKKAFLVNCDAPSVMARYAESKNKRLLHISTDYVFDGLKASPYVPDDQTNPLSEYGKSKRGGEIAVSELSPENSVVIRTSWLYSEYGSNFVKKILAIMAKQSEIKVVNDQRGSPTYARTFAEVIWRIVKKKDFVSGIYHWANSGDVSWFEFAETIKRIALSKGILESDPVILPLTSSDYPAKALRPYFSVLDSSILSEYAQLAPIAWNADLEKMLDRYTPN